MSGDTLLQLKHNLSVHKNPRHWRHQHGSAGLAAVRVCQATFAALRSHHVPVRMLVKAPIALR